MSDWCLCGRITESQFDVLWDKINKTKHWSNLLKLTPALSPKILNKIQPYQPSVLNLMFNIYIKSCDSIIKSIINSVTDCWHHWDDVWTQFSCICSGTIGSTNMDNIDNRDEDFLPLTVKRSVVPPYTATARYKAAHALHTHTNIARGP